MTKNEFIQRYGLEAYEKQKSYNNRYNKTYRKNRDLAKNVMPKNPKQRVDTLISRGKFTEIDVHDKGELKITMRALQQRDPDGYYEITENYLIYLNGNKLVAYVYKPKEK